MEPSPELKKRIEALSEDELKKFVSMIEQKKKTTELQELEYEYLKQSVDLREVPFKSNTEMGEAFNNLDDNSYLDMNSRLSDDEIAACSIIDELQRMGVFPKNANITKTFKRLKVSQQGKGRQEKVSIVTGARQQKAGGNFLENLFKRRKQQEEDVYDRRIREAG